MNHNTNKDLLDPTHYNINSELQKKIAVDIFKYHKFKATEKILDIGCGDGYITSLLSQFGVAMGIDSSINMINYATQQYQSNHCHFKHVAIEDYAPNEKYSLLTAFNSIYWCKDLPRLFKKLYTILDETGSLLIVTYPKESPYWSPFTQLLLSRKYSLFSKHSVCNEWLTEEDYINEIKKAGFRIQFHQSSYHDVIYYNQKELEQYVMGWLPCLIPKLVS